VTDADDELILVDGEVVTEAHVPDEVLAPWFRRFVLGVAIARLGIPIVSFFTVVAPLVASISGGNTDNILWLLLVRPSKEVLLWGGGLWRTTGGEVDLWLLFLAYAPLMIVMNWAFFFIGRAWGPALAHGEGPRWLQRSITPEQFARARTLLAKHGPIIAVVGRIAVLPPTVMSAAAGTSDIGVWRYQIADTIGGIAGFVSAVAVGIVLGETYEQGGLWLLAGGLVLVVLLLWWMTRWLQQDAQVEHVADDGE
jgi:membrane protein DedA with SNARE-associated domain